MMQNATRDNPKGGRKINENCVLPKKRTKKRKRKKDKKDLNQLRTRRGQEKH